MGWFAVKILEELREQLDTLPRLAMRAKSSKPSARVGYNRNQHLPESVLVDARE